MDDTLFDVFVGIEPSCRDLSRLGYSLERDGTSFSDEPCNGLLSPLFGPLCFLLCRSLQAIRVAFPGCHGPFPPVPQ